MSFRVVTFNIQNGEPFDESNPNCSDQDIIGTCQFLQRLDADLLFLQEVERGVDGGMQVEPPPNYQILKNHFPSHDSVFSYPLKNDTEIPFGLGLAIFSKTPLRDFHKIDLPAADLEFEFAGKRRHASPRLLIEVSTTIDGRDIRLMNTHLQAFFMIGSSSESYLEQRNIIEQRLKYHSHGPTILTGDMNSAPGECIVEQFSKIGFETAQNTQATWQRHPYIVDHIFFNAQLVRNKVQVIQSSVSDHFPLVADMNFS